MNALFLKSRQNGITGELLKLLCEFIRNRKKEDSFKWTSFDVE